MVDKTARGAISVLRFQLLSLINKDFKDKFNKEMKYTVVPIKMEKIQKFM